MCINYTQEVVIQSNCTLGLGFLLLACSCVSIFFFKGERDEVGLVQKLEMFWKGLREKHEYDYIILGKISESKQCSLFKRSQKVTNEDTDSVSS